MQIDIEDWDNYYYTCSNKKNLKYNLLKWTCDFSESREKRDSTIQILFIFFTVESEKFHGNWMEKGFVKSDVFVTTKKFLAGFKLFYFEKNVISFKMEK